MIRPVWPGASSEMTTTAEPSAGIRIAVTLRNAAERVTRDYIRWAREAGLSWHETAAALDLGAGAKERGQALSEAAFEYATGGGPGDWDWPPSFTWTCQACGHHITDRGPYKGHPEDRESGHAGGCGRLAAEITAYREGQPVTPGPSTAVAQTAQTGVITRCTADAGPACAALGSRVGPAGSKRTRGHMPRRNQ